MSLPNLNGHFVYRSLLNSANVGDDFGKLRFGAGIMTLVQNGQGQLSGDFDMGGGFAMKLTGTVAADGNHATVRLTGTGIATTPTAGWVYDYMGTVSPTWPKGIKQVQTITGSVIRTVDHGASKAGATATFYLVKKD